MHHYTLSDNNDQELASIDSDDHPLSIELTANSLDEGVPEENNALYFKNANFPHIWVVRASMDGNASNLMVLKLRWADDIDPKFAFVPAVAPSVDTGAHVTTFVFPKSTKEWQEYTMPGKTPPYHLKVRIRLAP